MKNPFVLLFKGILIIIIIIFGYRGFFYKPELTEEAAHIEKLIERIPEYVELMKNNDGNVHIDIPRDTSKDILNVNILTFKLNGEPAKIAYRLQYDKILDSIISIKKEP